MKVNWSWYRAAVFWDSCGEGGENKREEEEGCGEGRVHHYG